MSNNYLLNTPVGHLDEFDLEALRNWKSGILDLPFKDDSLVASITARIERLETHIKGRRLESS